VLLLAARAEREADEAHLPDGLDNPVSGIVRRYLSLGDRVRMTLEVPDAAGALLSMTLPRHLADRLSPTEGSAIALRLRGAAIHVIPAAREG
jgi:molybdate transport system ATP-binding protein